MSIFKKTYFILIIAFFIFSCASSPASGQNIAADREAVLESMEMPPLTEGLTVSSFSEIWAYVVSGYEGALKSNLPISDVVYFGAEVDRYGHLAEVPKRAKLAKYNGRVHIAIACNSAGLTHFVIEPGSKARASLVREILDAASAYDGLNIDLEMVPSKDAENFFSFLGELRAGLGRGKVFSVCVPARTSDNNGPYNYSKIAFIADKVFVMAYDEHWSTSKPGPVASMDWCRNVATHALKTISKEKLVMGIPFYGRAWGNTSTSRALVNATTERIKQEHDVRDIQRVNGIPTFTYEVLVKVTVFYEDEYSISARLDMYRKQGIISIGFWRLGQETMAVWPTLNLDTHLAVR
ncbi:MAG: glycoside hydrolase [Spirochaetaceae bacterium]|jgi:spore germination protein YaaH|nr:glycoside hydrolase [Spirochaetaceae bacterium]